MIEAMEQQIINSISNRWRKNKEKRKEIDIDRLTECFRTICSSRNSTLSIVNKLKYNQSFEDNLIILKDNLLWIYDWVTKDCINAIYLNYNKKLKNKKNEAKYLKEIPEIELFLDNLKDTVIVTTIDKLILFHDINKGIRG